MKIRLRKRLVLLTATVIVVAVYSFCMAMEIHTTGYGTVYDDGKAAARDRAIEDAQRKAVEQAMGTMVSVETITQNYQLIDDRILSLASGYIQRYQVTSESEKGNEIEVTIVAEVGVDKLSDSLQAIKNLIRRMDKPKLMVLIAEQSIREEGSAGTGANVSIAQQYVNMGPRLMERPELAEWARRAGRLLDIEVRTTPIRGGTGVDPFIDQGVPVANLGTGYFAPESEKEFTSMEMMARHAQWLCMLVQEIVAERSRS